MAEEKTAIVRARICLKTGEVLEREIIGYSDEPIDWEPLVKALYEDIKKAMEAESA